MRTTPDQTIIPSRKYALCEACALLGKSRQTIRRREEAGFIHSHINRQNGRRWYWGRDLIRLSNF